MTNQVKYQAQGCLRISTRFFFAIAIAFGSMRCSSVQTRTYHSARNTRTRRSYEYDEQSSGRFPNRKSHLLKKKKVQAIHKSKAHSTLHLNDTIYLGAAEKPKIKQKRPAVSEIENASYGGISFSAGVMPFVMNGDINLQMNYLQNNVQHSYTGSMHAHNYNNYYNTLGMCVEIGTMNGGFASLSTKAILLPDMETTPNLTFNFILGRNYVFHNNHWRFSPAVGWGLSFSSINFDQTIDNSQGDVLLLGRAFPRASTTNNSTTYSNKITPYVKSVGGDLKIQATLAPRIKNDFPIRFTIGYGVNFLNQLSLGAESPLARTEFSYNSPGVHFTNSTTSPNHTFANQGLYFEIAFFLNTARTRYSRSH